VYNTPFRLWGLDAVTDQQIAGVMMKLGEAVYIWGLILVLFFKWSSRHMEADRAGVVVTERDVLTWDAVQRELDELAHHGPAPTERKAP
jgi:cytochrome c oxidase assembly factor CtaG